MKQLSALLLILCLFGCGGGSVSSNLPSGTNTCAQTNPANIQVIVMPQQTTVAAGQSKQFNASIVQCTNTHGSMLWSVQEGSSGGAVSQSGFYTAPLLPGTYHVLLAYGFSGTQTKTGAATITVQ